VSTACSSTGDLSNLVSCFPYHAAGIQPWCFLEHSGPLSRIIKLTAADPAHRDASFASQGFRDVEFRAAATDGIDDAGPSRARIAQKRGIASQKRFGRTGRGTE
jgi:hypothetical protein